MMEIFCFVLAILTGILIIRPVILDMFKTLVLEPWIEENGKLKIYKVTVLHPDTSKSTFFLKGMNKREVIRKINLEVPNSAVWEISRVSKKEYQSANL